MDMAWQVSAVFRHWVMALPTSLWNLSRFMWRRDWHFRWKPGVTAMPVCCSSLTVWTHTDKETHGHTHMHTNTHTHTHTHCIHIHMHTNMHTHTHTHTCTHTHIAFTYTCTQTCTLAHTCMCELVKLDIDRKEYVQCMLKTCTCDKACEVISSYATPGLAGVRRFLWARTV